MYTCNIYGPKRLPNQPINVQMKVCVTSLGKQFNYILIQ